MSITITPSTSKLNDITFDQFLGTVLRPASSTDHIVIDLTTLQFIDLFAMIGLIFSCSDLLEAHSCEVGLEISGTDACGFLPRAGFFDVLPSDINYTAPSDLVWWTDDRWITRKQSGAPRVDTYRTRKRASPHIRVYIE